MSPVKGGTPLDRAYDDRDAIAVLKHEEGFRGVPYDDADGQSIGYGCYLPLSEQEAEMLLKHRFGLATNEVFERVPGYASVSDGARLALRLMAYQMGVPRLLKFKKLLAALEASDYHEARRQALDSVWAKQTPARARRVAALFLAGDLEDA